MEKSLSYEELVKLEDIFDKFTKRKKACLSQNERAESLNDFVTTYRDDDAFQSVEEFEQAVFTDGVWTFKCDTKAPKDPRPEAEAEAEDKRRFQNGETANGFGYYFKTTFWQDFTIADRYGKEAVQDTFNRAFPEWRGNCIYLTELVLVLNWKIWTWHEAAQKKAAQAAEEHKLSEQAKKAAEAEQDPKKKQEFLHAVEEHKTQAVAAQLNATQADELATLYDKLWKEADEFALDNLKGEEISYFYEVTD